MRIANLKCDLLFECRQPLLRLILGEISARKICFRCPVGNWNFHGDGSAVVWEVVTKNGLQIISPTRVYAGKEAAVWEKVASLACKAAPSVDKVEICARQQLVAKILDVDLLILQVL